MRKERNPARKHFNMVFLRQALVRHYGWTYEEVNSMRLHDAQVAALLGRHGRDSRPPVENPRRKRRRR